MTLLGIKHDSGWRNQPVKVQFRNGVYNIYSEGLEQTSSFMFDKDNNLLRRKIEYEEFFENLTGEGHLFNHLGVSADINIRIGEKTYKILVKKGEEKLTLISGYVEKHHLDDIVSAVNEEISEELLIQTGSELFLPGRRLISDGGVVNLERAFDKEKSLDYGKYTPLVLLKYTDDFHYLLMPLFNDRDGTIILNGKELPSNFNLYFDGRTNAVQLIEKLRLELMEGERRLEVESNFRFIQSLCLSFHHTEDKRDLTARKERHSEELQTIFNNLGIVLGGLEIIDERRNIERNIRPNSLNGRFYEVIDGNLRILTRIPKILSERFANMSPHHFVESDITVEDYLRT